MPLMCLVGCAVPRGAAPFSVLTEVPSAPGSMRYMGSHGHSGPTERNWPRTPGGRSPVMSIHGTEALSS